MQNHEIDKRAALLNSIGDSILNGEDPVGKHLWLFAEVGEGWAGVALFKVGKGQVIWVDDYLMDLADSLIALWESEPPERRFDALVFELQGTKFDSHFYYAGELPFDETGYDRREGLIHKRFGNYAIVYPPD